MKMLLALCAAAALLVGSGAALAQKEPSMGEAGPSAATSSHPETHPQSATPDRPAAAAMPQANKPSPETTGQAPSSSEKMDPGMDTVGGTKTAPGEEKK